MGGQGLGVRDPAAHLGLVEQQQEAVDHLRKARKLCQTLKMYPNIEKTLLPLAYVLFDLGALIA